MFDDVTFGAMLGAVDSINSLEDAIGEWQQHANKLENQLSATQAASDRHYDLYTSELHAHEDTRAQVNQATASAERSHALYVSEHTVHQKTKATLSQTMADIDSDKARNATLVAKVNELMAVAEMNKALTARVAELEASLERAESFIDDLGSENAQLHCLIFH